MANQYHYRTRKEGSAKTKIKPEVANIPAYSRAPKSLQKNYDFLPDGYNDTLIMVETIDEIMADKLVSLVGCQRYIRNRDIWDLRWLKQQGAKVQSEYILSKINDYKEENYPKNIRNLIPNIYKIVRGKNFKDEMTRFIPTDVIERTLDRENFVLLLINEVKSLLQEFEKIV